ncbi:T9SS type B sorting domain-containing protein [Flavobacterium nackdongense]|nr:T9SS type B sorting domain-containing protein [Flavobacterium nackdongense]
MKKPTFSRAAYGIVLLVLLLGNLSFGQNLVPFSVRYPAKVPGASVTLKGDILQIGNNILSLHKTNDYNGTSDDEKQSNIVDVDIDTDATTYNSSSADLVVPNPSCYKVKYAGLYWGATVAGDINMTPVRPILNVKFKMPTGGYVDLVGEKIYRGTGTCQNTNQYACYADVTALITSLGVGNAGGTYTVANISTRIGDHNGVNSEGFSGGWSLFIIYEDPNLNSKNITTFDGFSGIGVKGINPTTCADLSPSVVYDKVDIPVSGFQTIPVGPVVSKFAFAVIDGDLGNTGDYIQFKGSAAAAFSGNISLSSIAPVTVLRPATNFFNSTVTIFNNTTNSPEIFLARNPKSTNTLGFDAGIFKIPNASNAIIPNNETSATIRIGTKQEIFYLYSTAFAVDVIEPKIVLTKTVWNTSGVNIGNQTVNLGQFLDYKITFQNTGNDNVTVFEIKDILPINVIYSGPSSLTLPAGVTLKSWVPATRTLIFSIDPSKVQVKTTPTSIPVTSPLYTIVMRVQVVPDCTLLSNACSNIINNKAFASYTGEINSVPFSEESFDTNSGCLLIPQATNFLANVDGCVYKYPAILCGASVDIKAGDGYNIYSWSKSPFLADGTPTGAVIGKNQTLTVTAPGTYYVYDTAVAPCRSIMQEFTVTPFGGTLTNPVIPFADEVLTCPNDGKKLPNIFLCGANAIRDIKTGISDGSVIVWEKLNEASCAAIGNTSCANESTSCSWTQVGTGPNFQVNASGQYRVTLNYAGGCFNRYYFNVYQNLLNPTVTSNDIICSTPGKITVGGVPSGYEYSLNAAGPWVPTNVFLINSPGNYTVYIKQTAVSTNPCIFSVPNVQIRQRNFTVTPIINQPLCHGDKGNVTLQINDVRPQYYVTVRQAGVTIFSSGPDSSNSYHFNNLNSGTYDYTVTTDDGCTATLSATIVEPPAITATAVLTKPLTCTDGEITVSPIGGTPPYSYFVNSTTVFQGTPQIAVSNPLPPGGVYTIKVVDSNNCETTTSITVAASLPPVYSITKTDLQCSGTNTGGITINVSNTNGNNLRYSLDNGVTFFNSNVFSNLVAGNYVVIVEYALAGNVCLSAPQTITIAPIAPLTGTATMTAAYTCLQTATITATASGGTSPYLYSIDGVNFVSSPIFSGLTAGTYTITAKDSKNCTVTINPAIVIASVKGPTDLTITATDLICPENVSHVNIAAVGGLSPLRYRIISAPATYTITSVPSPYNSDGEFKYLPEGVYVFEVKDRNDCVYQETYNLVPIPPISVSGKLINNVKCYNTATGSMQFDVVGNFTGGSKVYSYSITGPVSSSASNQTAPTIIVNNLPAGIYIFTATDKKTGCTDSATVTISQPALPLTISNTVTPIKCNSNGSVVIDATGGWGGNNYTLLQPNGTQIGPQTNNGFYNLTQTGTYTVSVTDANGCTTTATFTLNPALPPVVNIAGSDLCYDSVNQATIIVNASGGVSPYQYSIDNGIRFQTSNTFANLTPGNYTVLVKDDFGCTSTALIQNIAPQLTVNTILTKDLDCSASPNAQITGTITGGTSGYNYSVSINGGPYSAPVAVIGTTFTYAVNAASISAATTYQFQVTDVNNCPALSGIITINPLSLPDISAVTQTQQIYCNGDNSAAINVAINTTVGTGPFVINVLNTSTGTNYGTQTTGLAAGNYTITITDSKLCTAIKLITINEPAALTAVVNHTDITCNGTGTSMGSISGTPTGGVGPYTYTITNNVGAVVGPPTIAGGIYTFDILNFGVYQLSFTDANSCTVTNSINIASPPSDLNINTAAGPPSCSSASVIVSVNPIIVGGPYHFALFPILSASTPPYEYASNMGSYQNADVGFPLQATFSGLKPGVIYSFIVYDEATNCYYFKQATSPTQTSSTLTSTVSPKNVSCLGANDGSVDFTFTNTYPALTNVTYQIFNSQTNLPTTIPIGTVVGLNGVGITSSVSNVGPLAPGTYYILFQENSGGANNGCTNASATFTITESSSALAVSASVIKNQNCTVLGQINVLGQGGTPSYTYQVLPASSPAPVASSPGWLTTTTFNLAGSLSGVNYIGYAKDANGCIIGTPISMFSDPVPIIAASINNQCSATEGNFAINVTMPTLGIAPYTFSIDGGAFQAQTAPFTISNLSSGVHTVEVKDRNGCGNKVTITIFKPLGLTPTLTSLPTCATNDGTITVAGVGGTGIYSYAISPSAPSITLSGNVFSGVPAGAYTVTITDLTSLCTKSAIVNLPVPTPVSFTTAVTNVSCNGDTNGTITVALLPGNNNPTYTYEIISPIIVAPQSSNVFTGLAAGTYTVRVNSSRGCSATDSSVTINQPLALAVDPSTAFTPFGCLANNSFNDATLTINAAAGSGTAPYTYSLDGTNYFPTNTFTIVDNGTAYNLPIYIKDTKGCLATSTIAITPLPKITAATVGILSPIDCNNTGLVSVTVTGGSGNFSYQILPNGLPQVSNSFTVVNPGSYYFRISDNTTGCYFDTSAFVVAPFDTIDVVATPITPVTCFGDSNGELSIAITGYTGDYSYQVLDSSNAVVGSGFGTTATNPTTISGIKAGNFTVVVTETNPPFCVKTSNTFTIESPAVPLSIIATQTSSVTCTNNQGAINATATGGWGSLTYELVGPINVPYSANGLFSNLIAGSYTVNVKDSKGCIRSSLPINLSLPAPISIVASANTSVLSCYGDTNASITVSSTTGGQGSNYSYSLNTISATPPTSSGPQTATVFAGLGVGTYTITATDGWNCTAVSTPISISQPTELSVSLVLASSQTCLSQARLQLSASGGTAPYRYSSDGISYSTTSFNSSVTIAVAPGTYRYYVRDANNCTSFISNDIEIVPIPTLSINLDITNAKINCFGDNTGVIVAKAEGGLGNYVYTLLNGSGTAISPAPVQSSPGVFVQLAAGSYQVKVDSGDCVKTTATITINQPTLPLVAPYSITNVTCSGAGNGQIVINASGGTGTIKYAISPNLDQFFDTNLFKDLNPNNYTAIVQDVLGCYVTFNFTISEPLPLQAATVSGSIIPEICSGDSDGQFSIDISGGTSPYKVSLDQQNGPFTTGVLGQTLFDFKNINGGSHIVYVVDAMNCSYTLPAVLPDPVTLKPVAIVDYDCLNNLPNNTVTVAIDPSVLPVDVDYALDGIPPYQASNVFTKVPAGEHFISARHTNGCIQQTQKFTILQVNPLAVSLVNGGINEIVATTTGGSGNYHYTFNGESTGTTNTYIIYKTGSYTVDVVDAEGCTATDTKAFTYIDIDIPNVFTPDGDGNNDTWGPTKTTNYPDLIYHIYDRYGRKIATYNEGQFWDGKYNGFELPSGDYWYLLKLNNDKDEREFVGHFTLYR